MLKKMLLMAYKLVIKTINLIKKEHETILTYFNESSLENKKTTQCNERKLLQKFDVNHTKNMHYVIRN